MNIIKNRKALSTSTIIIVLCTLYIIIRNIFIKNSFSNWGGSFCFVFLSSIFSVMILFTYNTHNKNAMKPAIGMLLGVNTYQ